MDERQMIQDEVDRFREKVERTYHNKRRMDGSHRGGSFGEILCYELHEQPVNPRMGTVTPNEGCYVGLTFRELAKKWGISVTFLGELIADHCRKLEETKHRGAMGDCVAMSPGSSERSMTTDGTEVWCSSDDPGCPDPPASPNPMDKRVVREGGKR